MAGGVPHYTDYRRHVRLGDVVVSAPNKRGFTFMFCDELVEDGAHGQLQTMLKGWSPRDNILLETVKMLIERHNANYRSPPWEAYISQGAYLLHDQLVKFNRPPLDTDRLFMSLGDSGMIEMEHPHAPDETDSHSGITQIKCGTIGSGKPIVSDDILRLDFAARHDCIAFDTEFDQVLESVVGNRKDSFAFIKGICDYYDGTKSLEWQPFAALAAAAVMKTVIENLPVT